MRYAFFTKSLKEQGIDQLIETLHQLKFDGADMCVREGFPVNPHNCRTELPRAAKRFRDAGLAIPLVSTDTNLIDPESSTSEFIFRACHDAGILDVKIGYWTYRGGDYWRALEAARKGVEGFAQLGSRYGIRVCLHTHSGSNLGVNASALMQLLSGYNPSQVGAYLDPGHLAINGEPLRMAFDMTARYLALVAVKDSQWVRAGKAWQTRFVPLGDGLVDWSEMMRILRARQYQDWLSLHSEYHDMPVPDIIKQTGRDLEYLRRLDSESARSGKLALGDS